MKRFHAVQLLGMRFFVLGAVFLLGLVLFSSCTSKNKTNPSFQALPVASPLPRSFQEPSSFVLSHPSPVESFPISHPSPTSRPSSKVAPLAPDLAQAPNSNSMRQTQSELENVCFIHAFSHPKLKGHESSEACSSHKNTVQIPHSKIVPSSLCVRVNGKPVRHQIRSKPSGGQTQIAILTPLAPDSAITARFCTENGKTCPQLKDCKIPKDSFLQALGDQEAESGIEDEDLTAEDSKEIQEALDPDIQREMKLLTQNEAPVMWIKDSEVKKCEDASEKIKGKE